MNSLTFFNYSALNFLKAGKLVVGDSFWNKMDFIIPKRVYFSLLLEHSNACYSVSFINHVNVDK